MDTTHYSKAQQVQERLYVYFVVFLAGNFLKKKIQKKKILKMLK